MRTLTSHSHGSDTPCCHGESPNHRPWWLRPLPLFYFGVVSLLVLSYVVPSLHPFRHAFFEYVRLIWWAILLGFVLGGVVDHYVPREYVSKALAQPRKRTVFYSVGLGLMMSACSHGVLALAMELHKKGASGPAVVSFLLASPWANLPVTLLLIGFFGWHGWFIIVAALLIALSTGLIFQFLDRKGLIERNRHSVSVDRDFSIRKDIVQRFKSYQLSGQQVTSDIKGVGRGASELIGMVMHWLVIGLLLASAVSAFVPETFMGRFMGPTLFGLFVTLLAATALEVCSEGTAPVAFELYRQTGAFGNSFVFLMGGVVTDYTEIGLLWSNLGRRTALWMIAVSVPQVLVAGWLLNIFLSA